VGASRRPLHRSRFIVNRVNRPFTLEALALLAAGRGGVTMIDAAIRDAGYPMGPFELMDLTGVDINLAAALGVFERSRAAADPSADRFRPSPIQDGWSRGRLGGRRAGFYEYGRMLARSVPLASSCRGRSGPGPDVISGRISLAIVSGPTALGDGVATTADINLAAARQPLSGSFSAVRNGDRRMRQLAPDAALAGVPGASVGVRGPSEQGEHVGLLFHAWQACILWAKLYRGRRPRYSAPRCLRCSARGPRGLTRYHHRHDP
jgi:hypothetical protein